MEAKVAAPQYLRLLKDRPQSSLIKSRTLSLKANSEIELTSVHEVKIWHVLSGEGLVKQGHEKFRVYSGDTVYHPPLRSHGLKNLSKTQSLELIALWWTDYLLLNQALDHEDLVAHDPAYERLFLYSGAEDDQPSIDIYSRYQTMIGTQTYLINSSRKSAALIQNFFATLFKKGYLGLNELGQVLFPLEPFRAALKRYYAQSDLNPKLRVCVQQVLAKPLPAVPISEIAQTGITLPGFEPQTFNAVFELAPNYLAGLKELGEEQNWAQSNLWLAQKYPGVVFFKEDQVFEYAVVLPCLLKAYHQDLLLPKLIIFPEQDEDLGEKLDAALEGWKDALRESLDKYFHGLVPEARVWSIEAKAYYQDVRSAIAGINRVYRNNEFVKVGKLLLGLVKLSRDFHAATLVLDGERFFQSQAQTHIALQLMAMRSFAILLSALRPKPAQDLWKSLALQGRAQVQDPNRCLLWLKPGKRIILT